MVIVTVEMEFPEATSEDDFDVAVYLRAAALTGAKVQTIEVY